MLVFDYPFTAYWLLLTAYCLLPTLYWLVYYPQPWTEQELQPADQEADTRDNCIAKCSTKTDHDENNTNARCDTKDAFVFTRKVKIGKRAQNANE